jgi:uncharacterized membrane protein
MNILFAVTPVSTWSILDYLVFAIIVAAVVGITYAALQYFGIEVPSVVQRIVLIVAVAAFAILAIRFLFSL